MVVGVLIVLGAVLGATVFRDDIATAAGSAPVTVTNTAAQAVPTQVTNTAANPVPTQVRPVLTNQFATSTNIDLDDSNFNFTVPAGKVFVVESANVAASGDTGKTIGVHVIYAVGGTLASGSERTEFFAFPLTTGPTSATHTDYGYAGDPNINIGAGNATISLGRQDGTQNASAIVALSGYLVDAP